MSKVPYNIQQFAQSLGYLTVEYVFVFGEYDVYQCHSIKRGKTINGQIAEVFADDGYYIVDVEVPINGSYALNQLLRRLRRGTNTIPMKYKKWN